MAAAAVQHLRLEDDLPVRVESKQTQCQAERPCDEWACIAWVRQDTLVAQYCVGHAVESWRKSHLMTKAMKKALDLACKP